MSEKDSRQDKIRATVNRSRLIRLSVQILLSLALILGGSPLLRLSFAVILILYSLYAAFFLYLNLTGKHHLLHVPALSIPDMILTGAMLLAGGGRLFFPFALLLSAEMRLDKQKFPAEISFLFLTGAALLAGGILEGGFIPLIFPAPALLAQMGFMGILRIQEETNKGKYEYMKNLVDNKNKLLSTLTHELRTPLAVIKTSNELIMEERPGPINETQRSLIHSSIENTKRLNGLVENILSQVKVEFAWFSMKRQPLDIRGIIRKTALDIKPYLDTRGQSVKYSYPALLSKTIGDKRWLEQVLLNLIHNGSKNSPDDSVITIGVQENELCIVVSVHDRGSGIESKEIPHVFNEFYQSTDPTKNLNEGAGLGLTIVKDIIERHKGEVYISSQPRAGTTVSFSLPLYKGVFSGTAHSDN